MDDRAIADLVAEARTRARVLDMEWGYTTPHPAAVLLRRLANTIDALATQVAGVTANVIEGEHDDHHQE
jgi:hypothetical protein